MTLCLSKKLLLVLLFLALVVLATALAADAWTLLESDNFTGSDGDAPEASIWGYYESGSNEVVKIDGNKVRCTVVSAGEAYIYNTNMLYAKNFTILLDWQPKTCNGRAVDIRLLSQTRGYVVDWLTFAYDCETYGWSVFKRSSGSIVSWYSYSRNVVVDRWYVINITFKVDKFDITVKERSSGTQTFSRTGQSIDPLGDCHRYRIGTYASISSHSPDAYFDNYLLYMIGRILAPSISSPSNGSLFNSTPTLRWSVDHITGWTFQSYQVQLDDSPTMASPHLDTGKVSSSATSYRPPSLAEGRWYWRVRVENASTIWSRWSFNGYFDIDLTPPSKPGQPQDDGTWSTSKVLDFSWSAATDANGIAGYYVRVGTSPNGTDVVAGAYTASRFYKLTGAQDNSTYYISVAAKDRAGNVGPWSDPSNGIGVDTIGPIAGAVRDEGVYINRTSTTFEWDPSAGDYSGISSYYVYVGTNPNTADVLSGSLATGTNFTLTGAREGKTYYAWIRVSDVAGNVGPRGLPSDGVTVDLTGPTPPVVFDEGVYSTRSTLVFNWTRSTDLISGVDHYLVSIGTAAGGEDVARSVPTDGLSYTFAGAVEGTTYYVKVRARDVAGNLGPWSQPSDGITVDMTMPTSPSARDEGEWCNTSSTTFTWNPGTDGISGISHYLVYVGTTRGEGDVVSGAAILGRNITIANLTEGATYYCAVRAVDVAGNVGSLGAPSDGITVDTMGPVARRAYPAARWSTDGVLTWTWPTATDQVSGLDGYMITVGTTPMGDDVVSGQRLDGGSIGHQLDGGGEGVTYYLRLRAIDRAGNVGPLSEPSPPMTVDTRVERVTQVTDEGEWSSDPAIWFGWSPVTDAVSGVRGYRVYLGTSPDELDLVDGLLVNGTQFVYLDGEDGTTYYLAVATVDVAGNEAEPSPVTDGITVDMTAPASVPVRDEGEWTNSNVIAFVWDEPPDAGRIDRTFVAIRTASGGTVETRELEDLATRHELVGTVDGVTYVCRVWFRDLAGNVGEPGEPSDGITVDLTPPTQVDVASPPPFVLPGPLRFNWTMATDGGSGVAGYEVYVGTDPAPVPLLSQEGTTYALPSPLGGSTYHCRVRSVDVAGNAGPWSEPHVGVYVYDQTPQVGLELAGGALATASREITLTVSYQDPLPAVDMRASELQDMTGLPWRTYTATVLLTLEDRDSTHTVHVQVRNGLGVRGEASASIILDTTPPMISFDVQDGKTTQRAAILLRGTTEPAATLSYAGAQVTVAPDGSFEVEVPLALGKNVVELTATDELGNTGTGSIVVEREPASEWTPEARSVSILLVLVVLVLASVLAYVYVRGRQREQSEWEEMPEGPGG